MLLLTFQSELVPELFTQCKLLLYSNVMCSLCVHVPYAVYINCYSSSFSISPVNDINFGSIILNSKRTRSFLIENKGEFEFKYAITKLTQDKQR